MPHARARVFASVRVCVCVCVVVFVCVCACKRVRAHTRVCARARASDPALHYRPPPSPPSAQPCARVRAFRGMSVCLRVSACVRAPRQVFIQCSACGNRHSEFEAFFHCSCGTALAMRCARLRCTRGGACLRARTRMGAGAASWTRPRRSRTTSGSARWSARCVRVSETDRPRRAEPKPARRVRAVGPPYVDRYAPTTEP